jgi:SAM-dependent methyltransferase|tara:strand:- start:279 stop:902 length:624 start_codon:yes stop_codon:yes gene_type:complete
MSHTIEQEESYFDRQLSLNKKELSLSARRPPHWDHLIDDVSFFIESNEEIDTIRDVGCGSGALYQVVNDGLNGGNYYGYDKSEYAVKLAKENYSKNNFFVFDLDDLDENFIKNDNEIFYMAAVLDVLPNANKVLKKICSLGFRNILIHRMNIDDGPSRYSEYMAFDVMPTYAFYHNKSDLIEIVSENYDYEIYKNDNHDYNMRLIKK